MDFRKTGDGFAYMLVGDKHAVQLVVSLYSLRSFWRGPVALIVGDDAALNVARLCQLDARLGPVQVVTWEAPRGGGKGLQHANKTYIGELTPFDRTAFLDADTLITGDPTDLFPRADSDEIRLTRFANWLSNERPVWRRVEGYRKLCPTLVDRAQFQPLPAINTGTFGISTRATDYLLTWAHYSRTLPIFMSDELVAQIIFPDFPHTILDERWNCLAGDTCVCGEVEAVSKSFYRGQMTEIIMRSGRRLTVTPNHPIFTASGVVPAGQLQISDQLFAHDGQVDLPVSGLANGYYIQNRPSKIQDLFETFNAGLSPYSLRRESRSATPLDFHGDGESVHGDIEVIAFERELLDDVESGYSQECDNAVLDGTFQELPIIGGLGALSSRFFCVDGTTPGGYGVSGQRHAVGRVHPFESRPGGGSAVADWDAGGYEHSLQYGVGDAVFPRKRLHPLPGNVTRDEVIEIRNLRGWSGHVYDLRTLRGSILANGLYVSNCSPIFSWGRYAPPNNADVRIWHGHGWKFISRKTGREIWWPAYDRARTDNVAALAEWAPGSDRRLADITGKLERGEPVR